MAFQDFEEFIAALNDHGVRYLISGAHAVAFHAQPRATKDLDILIDPAPENAARAIDAMKAFFGGNDPGYTISDFVDPEWVIQLGVAPVRIDLLTSLAGVPDFAVAWEDRVDAHFGAIEAHYLGLDTLIRAKEAAGREQDRADLVGLRRVRGRPET
jgi:hypothetical protein